MKLSPFTIFLVILGLLVIITLLMNLRDSYKKESFINFQNHPQASGSSIYIPQYSANKSTKLLCLYDNVYFDTKNGCLIELFAGSCLKDCKTDVKQITDISIVSRDGTSLTAMPTVFIDGEVQTNNSPYSDVTIVESTYKGFVFTTSCKNTSIYQVLYNSWDKDTYMHIIDISGTIGTNIKSFYLNASGVGSAQDTFTTKTLQPFSVAPSTMTINKGTILPSSPDPKYLLGNVPVLQLGKDGNQNSVSYDISNGNIVISASNNYKVYNRNGNVSNNTQSSSIQFASIPNLNTFVINDITGLSVLVTGYNEDTIIQLIVPSEKTKYNLLQSYRFNKTSYVTNFDTDVKNNKALSTSAPTTPSSTSTSSSSSCGAPTSASSTCGGPVPTTSSECSKNNGIANLDQKVSSDSSVCGDDLSCKWYWYFNTIARKNGDDSTYFSDDYFLKTEAVPPVCPQCPSNGTCNNCGGNGGSGTSGITTPPVTNGVIKDKGGNVYVPYTDSSGNTKYMLSSSSGSSSGSSSDSIGTPKGTYLDSEGNLMTSANPNTVVGGLTTTALGVANTAGNVVGGLANTAGNVANNVVDSTTGLVGGAINSATGLVGGLANTAGNVVGGLGNVVGGVVGSTTNMIGNLGSGYGNSGMQGQGQQGQGQQQGQQQGQMNNGFGSVGSSLGYTTYSDPNKNAGYRPGYTPIDNYSQYGALQSKGGNYIPVTADFSSFRK